MAQLSLPYRIALVAMLAVCALWFTVLRPTDPGAEPTTAAPGTTGLANGVNAAKSAVAGSAAKAAATERATGGTAPAKKTTASGAHSPAVGAKATDTATPKASKPSKKKAAKAATGDRSAPLLAALDRDRAVVLLFFNTRGIEDRAVRRAVAAVSRHKGRVVVKAAPISQVGRYQAITRGVQVLQAPTTLVIAPGRTAKPIVGYTTTAELNQAVGDALAAKRAKK